MRIAICDDDSSVCDFIEDYIRKLKQKDIDFDVFTSGNELLRYLKNDNTSYQIYFMDIEMDGHNGIETAALIRAKDKNALIIFMTQHRDYVYKVFEVLPFRFLVKPVCTENIMAVFNDALLHLRTVKQIFTFTQDRATSQVFLDEIMYFENIGRKIKIVAVDKSYLFYGKMHEVYSRLDKILFVQIHTSYVVNMEYISIIKDSTITMKDNETLPISKKFRNEVKEQYFNYLEWRCGK